MRKIVLVIVSVLTVAITGLIVVAVLSYTGIIGGDLLDRRTVRVYEDENGNVYTEANWTWKPIESKKVISYHDDVSTKRRDVTLLLSDTEFYDMEVPDVPCVYDFGRTVWAEDGSFMIRVIGDASIDNLASLAGIDNGENMNQYTLRNKDGVKGQRILATLIGNTAIVVNVYSGDDAYSILFDSISKNRNVYEFNGVQYSKDCKVLSEVSYSGKYTRSVIVNDVSLHQIKYMFEDGSLWHQVVVKTFDDTCREYMIKICAFSRVGQIEELYNNGSVLYARSGDYYLAVISYNSNTCLTIVGQGEEAKCNIVSILADVK